MTEFQDIPKDTELMDEARVPSPSARVETGQQFARWAVLSPRLAVKPVSYSGNKKKKYIYFAFCECSCGNRAWVNVENMKRGLSESCGCLKMEKSVAASKTHGLSSSPIYAIWNMIKQRVLVPTCRVYKDYGGRGIDIDPRWKEFEAFLTDVGHPPFEGAELDRVDNDRGYWPDNVRWVTRKEQMRNIRNNRRFEFDGKNLTLGEWSEITGILQATLSSRLYSYDWSVERALTTPVEKCFKQVEEVVTTA